MGRRENPETAGPGQVGSPASRDAVRGAAACRVLPRRDVHPLCLSRDTPMQFILSNWPLTFLCGAMIVAAVIDGWKLKVPNWLTFPLVISGWLLGLTHDLGWLEG